MPRTLILRDDRAEHRVSIDEKGQVLVDDAIVRISSVGAGEVRVGKALDHVAWIASAGNTRWVYLDGDVYEIEVLRPGVRRRGASAHGSLTAPMPATVVRVEVTPGSAVRRGDTLIILEAMKMELPVRAPSDGVVTAVHCRPGELVPPGVSLVEMD